MFKKLLTFTTLLSTVLFIVGCVEITEDYNQRQQPAIELVNKGELIQIYDENVELEDVAFTVVFKQFTENAIQLENVTIHWYVRDQLLDEFTNKTTYTQVVNAPGEIPIKVEVIFTFEGQERKLEENQLINVVKTPTSIIVTNNLDTTTHRISVTLGGQSEVEFTARIFGNLNQPVFKWIIQKQTSGEPVLVEEIIAEVTVQDGEGTAVLVYNFEESGNFIVTLQTGDGISQDANRYLSNSTHIHVGYGHFAISLEESRVQTLQAGITSRTLSVTKLDESLVGEGEYVWYLNGVPLNHTGLSYQHTNSDLGGYLYEVHFEPTGDGPNLKTEPLLIINGTEVSTEAELLTALEEKVLGIVLTDDIEYSNESSSLLLDYPVTIYGDGYTLSSKEIEVFISVTHDQVYLSNVTILRANRYNLMMTRVKNIYLENIKVDELGGGSSPTSFLSGDFGSGIYVNKSHVTIKDVEFISGGLVGVRIDNDTNLAKDKATLELLGEFKFNSEDPLLLPIGSGKSQARSIELIASGFDYFALPAGDIVIRRWDNQGDPVTWELFNPTKITYAPGEVLDLFGIGISVDIAFLQLEISDANGLEFVKLYISLFKQYGKLEITTLDDQIQNTYYIIGESEASGELKLDGLAYGLESTLLINGGEEVQPILPETPGQYKVKIYIGEEFYLGHIIIEVKA